MRLHLDVEPGTFYDLGRGFFLPVVALPFKTELVVQPKLNVTCMMDIHIVTVGGERVGFFFTSNFETQNHGGYLLTTLHNKKPATEVETVIRMPDLVVYHYPNRGSLAICPLVSPQVATIFETQ